ncbi:hypothetical protein K1719_025170 [Acacia pycnantha]|nr:hypothetical protein K1719_025170 [Acacia pycnantha]
MVFWEGYVSDEVMGTFAPIVVYWVYAGFLQLLPPLDNYRLHTIREEEEKNLVSLSDVVKGVLLLQLVHAIVSLFMLSLEANGSEVIEQPSLPIQIMQIIIAMFVLDTFMGSNSENNISTCGGKIVYITLPQSSPGCTALPPLC